MPRCPSCGILMTLVEEDGITRKTCSSCFGDWMRRITMLHVVRGPLPADALPQPAAAVPADTGGAANTSTPGSAAGVPAVPSAPAAQRPVASLVDLAVLVKESNIGRPLRCPECQQLMRIGRVHMMIPVDVQFCDPCQGVWLDVGKLPLLHRLYYELLHSTDPKIIELRERLALADLKLEITGEKLDEAKNRFANSLGLGVGPGGNIAALNVSSSLDEVLSFLRM